MASRYTDVDLMLLKRWDEVNALREAFDHPLGRIEDVVQASLQKVSMTASERGLSSDVDLKRPSIWFWKREWATRRNEPGIYIQVSDFVPPDCGRGVEEYPSIWLMTDEWSKLRMRESSEDFARALRAALSPELLRKWSHHDADISESPLGRDCSDISDPDRVRLVSDPETLSRFVIDRIDEFTELIPSVDQALQTMSRR